MDFIAIHLYKQCLSYNNAISIKQIFPIHLVNPIFENKVLYLICMGKSEEIQ